MKPSSLEIPLRRSWGLTPLFVAILVPVAWLATETVRIGLAAWFGNSTQVPEVRRALTLDPASARLCHRLGMLSYQSANSLGQDDPKTGVQYLRRAVELNPLQPFYWSDLGAACEALGDRACASRAFGRSVELSPRMPQLQWLAANHYLRTGETALALAGFHRLLTLDPAYAARSFAVCLRVLDDPENILENIVPRRNDPAMSMALVNASMDQGQSEFAFRVWTQAASSSIPFALAKPYLERLLELGRGPEAEAVWRALLRTGAVRSPKPDEPEGLIFNGDFEQTPLNAGFDWRYEATPYLSLDFADPGAYQKSQCLRVEFAASRNEEYEPVYQIVPVASDQTYLLTAYARTDGITSDSGPRLRVVDPSCVACLDVSSDSDVGTTPWHPITLKFSTKPPTRFVKVSVWRARGRTFPADIAGIFWLDAVSLRAVSADTPKQISGPRSRT